MLVLTFGTVDARGRERARTPHHRAAMHLVVASVTLLLLLLALSALAIRRAKRGTDQAVDYSTSKILAKGDRIEVFWPAMEVWYAGLIKAAGVQDGVAIHCIRYDDKAVEWRDLSEAQWKRLPPLPPKPKARPASSPMRTAPMPTPQSPPRPSVPLSSSAHFRTQGYELQVGLLDDTAITTLREMALGVTRPINGEPARRQRPLEACFTAHTRVLRCLDEFLSARGLLAFEPSVLLSMPTAQRQRLHRDRGQGSLLAAFHEGTHLWVAPGSHLQPTSEPSDWEQKLKRIDIPPGCALLFDPLLVHAGGDASCPPRLHAYSMPNDRDRCSPNGDDTRGQRGYPRSANRLLPMRGDFGDA